MKQSETCNVPSENVDSSVSSSGAESLIDKESCNEMEVTEKTDQSSTGDSSLNQELSSEGNVDSYLNTLQYQLELLQKESDLESPDKNQPYLMKYQVRGKLFELLEKEIMQCTLFHHECDSIALINFAHFFSSPQRKKYQYLGKIMYKLGTNFFDCEEVSEAELFLFLALWMLVDDPQSLVNCYVPKNSMDESLGNAICNELPPIILSDFRLQIILRSEILEERISTLNCSSSMLLIDCIDTYNYFGVIWTNRQEFERALKWFEHCERQYEKYLETSQFSEKLSEIETLTTFYLAQVYGNLKQIHKAAKYSFLTLKRQLSSGLEFDVIQWIQNGLQLSGYFATQEDFAMSDHCLKSTEKIWSQSKDALVSIRDADDIQSTEANIQLARARFYFSIMEYSKNWIQNWRSHQDRLHKTTKYTDENLLPEEKHKIKGFSKLTDELTFEGVPKSDHFYVIASYDNALPLFKKVRKGLESALQYYVLDGFVSEHVKICQELSSTYSFLLFFEKNAQRRIALYKRRAAILDPIISQLNENYYKDTLKVLTFELGQIYSSIHEEYSLIEELITTGKELKQDLSIIKNSDNDAMLNSVKYFNLFHNYFKSKTGNIDVEEANRPAFVRAHFYLASIYYKIHSDDISLQRKFLVLSLKEYKFVTEYVESNNVKETASEYDMSKEMCDLIPFKLQRLQ